MRGMRLVGRLGGLGIAPSSQSPSGSIRSLSEETQLLIALRAE